MAQSNDPELLTEIQRLEQQLAALKARVVGTVEREALPEGALSLLVFRLGEERVAILQSQVVEVLMMARLTALPEAPAWVPGVLNCRGQSVLVLDALARLTRTRRRPELSDLIVVVDFQGRRFGLIVQEILEVVTVPSHTLQAPSKDLEQAPYLLGVLPSASKTTLLFSIGALLGTSGLPVIEP